MARYRTHSWTAVAVALAAVVSARDVAAQRRAEPRRGTSGAEPSAAQSEAYEHFRRASEAFAEGDYGRALEGFRLAYSLEPRPSMIFNLAQVYRAIGLCDRAMAEYRRFLQATPRLEPERRAEIEATLADASRHQSTLSVSTQPVGARLFVNGWEVGFTPRASLSLCTGTHRVRLELPGYVPFGEMVTVAADRRERLAVRLAPAQGAPELEVRATPASALIALDGIEVGEGRVRRQLAPGGHLVEVRAPGFAPWSQELMLGVSQQRAVDVHLQRASPFPWGWVIAGGSVVLTAAIVTPLVLWAVSQPVCPNGPQSCISA